jgi:putative transposase
MTHTVKRLPRRSRDQWQEIIHNQAQSGLSVQDFCEQNGIGYASFHKWRNRFSAKADISLSASDNTGPGFIDLSNLSDSQQPGWHIVLKLGNGMELQLTRS